MLCMLILIELKKMQKEMMLFFVLQIQEIMQLVRKFYKTMNDNLLKHYLIVFQFSVSGSIFSVFNPEPGEFNSLYRESGSLKN